MYGCASVLNADRNCGRESLKNHGFAHAVGAPHNVVELKQREVWLNGSPLYA